MYNNITSEEYFSIKEITNNLVEKYNVDIPCDPQIIANGEGYRVVFSSYDKPMKNKIASYILDNNTIHINNDLCTFDIIFSIAHELGIGILNLNRNRVFQRKHCENIFYDNQPIVDIKANIFAMNLLISPVAIKKVFDWIYIDNAIYCQSMWESYSRALCVKEYILKNIIDNCKDNEYE